MSVVERAKRWLSKRLHYRACFYDDTGQLTRSGQVVVKDLATFGYAYKTTAIHGPTGIDPIASAIAEGRREMFLRLQAMLKLPDRAVMEAMESD